MRPDTGLNHKIWRVTWPMIIANISVPLLGIVDTAILGHLNSPSHLAAVAVSSTILAFLYWGFGFLRMGTTGLSAQAYGANDHNELRLILGQAAIMGLGIGLAIVLLSPWLLNLGLWLIPPPSGTEELAAQYSHIRIFSAPAVMLNFAIVGWLIGKQNTRQAMWITVWTNVINIVLDLVFILGLGMDSKGAALATLIAEYSGCGLAIYLMIQQLKTTPGSLQRRQLWLAQSYNRLLHINSHLFIRTLALLASFAFFTAQGAQQGDVMLSANAILINLLLLTSFGLDSLAQTAETLTGDAMGQRNHTLFIKVCQYCGFWSLIVALGFTLIFYIAGEHIISLFTSLIDVKTLAISFLPWVTALPLISMWAYLLDGIFIGATKTKAMQNSMLLSAFFIYLPCWYATQHWGNHGLWFAFLAFNAARGLSLGWVFYRNNQQKAWH